MTSKPKVDITRFNYVRTMIDSEYGDDIDSAFSCPSDLGIPETYETGHEKGCADCIQCWIDVLALVEFSDDAENYRLLRNKERL